jgi:hypothetical protein
VAGGGQEAGLRCDVDVGVDKTGDEEVGNTGGIGFVGGFGAGWEDGEDFGVGDEDV